MTNTTSNISLFNPEGKLMATGNFGDWIVLETRWSSLPCPALEHALIASSPRLPPPQAAKLPQL